MDLLSSKEDRLILYDMRTCNMLDIVSLSIYSIESRVQINAHICLNVNPIGSNPPSEMNGRKGNINTGLNIISYW